jgi:hypothetical protein
MCVYPVALADGSGGAGGAGGTADPFYNPCMEHVDVEPVCVDVPFTYRSDYEVVGVINL